MAQAFFAALMVREWCALAKRECGHQGLGSARGDPLPIRGMQQILHYCRRTWQHCVSDKKAE